MNGNGSIPKEPKREREHNPNERSQQEHASTRTRTGAGVGSTSAAYQGYTFPPQKQQCRTVNDGIDESPPPPPPLQLDRVHASQFQNSTNPDGAQFFFRNYVAARRPCIIEHWWPDDDDDVDALAERMVQHLLLQSTTTEIAVEERDDQQQSSFGQGRRVHMTVGEFWNTKLATQRYYLSTQPPPPSDVDKESEEQPPPPPFYGPPCHHLHEAQLLPDLSPRLTGNLQLSSCNLWVGCCGSSSSSSGDDNQDDNATSTQSSASASQQPQQPTGTTTTSSTSGLHHDFHDNFYCLLQGRKRFYLYAPTEACALGIVNATLHHVNGLLSYQPNTRDDGRVMMTGSRRCDEPKDATTTTTPVASVVALEDNLPGRDHNHPDDNDDDDEQGEVVWGKGFDYESSSDDDDDARHVAIDAIGDEEDEIEAKEEHNSDDDDDDDSTTNELPNHFSWIDPTAASKATIAQTFPAYANTTECVVELQPGEILYLPASWFHCVTSMAGNDTTLRNTKGVHMAVNYWFHPPDNLTDFDHPYRDREYWEQSNNNKKTKLEAM